LNLHLAEWLHGVGACGYNNVCKNSIVANCGNGNTRFHFFFQFLFGVESRKERSIENMKDLTKWFTCSERTEKETTKWEKKHINRNVFSSSQNLPPFAKCDDLLEWSV